MANRTWVRPASVPYPSVWSKFIRQTEDGTNVSFEIRDITQNLYASCVDHMTKYFLADEPMYTSLGFLNDMVSVHEQREWWKEILPEKLSLACVVKDGHENSADPQIVGVNFLYYHHKSDDATPSKLNGDKLKTVCDIVKHVENQIDRYTLLKMEDYIDEFGLCVHPDFRGMGIATELLKAREKLGKAVGIKTTLTMFTAIASQKAADKAGFQNLVEMKYSDLANVFPQDALEVKDTPTIRYMCKLLSDI